MGAWALSEDGDFRALILPSSGGHGVKHSSVPRKPLADVPQSAMVSLAVVVGFDVFKHSRTHLAAARDALAMDALDLQAVEEALRTGVLVAVALGAHAASQVVDSDQLLVGRRAVLAASVAVHDHPSGLLSSPQRHALPHPASRLL